MFKRKFGRQSGKRQSRGGRRADLGNRYYRSMMEANVARVLNWYRMNGVITKWEYEADEFEFPIKRGTRFYKPDFKVWRKDGSVVYWEVKGWMDPKSRTQLKRMAKYHPTVEIDVIDGPRYREFERTLGAMLPYWECGKEGVALKTGETVTIGRHVVTDPALLARIQEAIDASR